jgi:multidrug resistance efflux pump
MKADYDRTMDLFGSGIMEQRQLDLAKANYDSANAGVSGAARRHPGKRSQSETGRDGE